MAPRPPPAPITDDLIIEILLRLPPEDIACLTRASHVCKAWRRLLSDRSFFRRYREIHRAPPLLGFLHNNYSDEGSSPFFVPTTPASPFSPRASAGSPTNCRTLDCRHGRVLVHHPGPGITSCLTVWDPVTGLQRCISAQVTPLMAAVLCAAKGCDHLDCSSDGPYLMVLLRPSRRPRWTMSASVYTSETRKWSVSATVLHDYSLQDAMPSPSLLAGDALFFLVGSGRVLKYDLTSGLLSVIWLPFYPQQNMILCTAEDGGLGAATVQDGSLWLLNSRTGPDGDTSWRKGRVIALDSMIPDGVHGAWIKSCVVGSAEGTGYIFVRAKDCIFSVEVMSGRISKMGSGNFGPIFPLMGFYIPDLQVPMGMSDQ